jgi:hypothetical protein
MAIPGALDEVGDHLVDVPRIGGGRAPGDDRRRDEGYAR